QRSIISPVIVKGPSVGSTSPARVWTDTLGSPRNSVTGLGPMGPTNCFTVEQEKVLLPYPGFVFQLHRAKHVSRKRYRVLVNQVAAVIRSYESQFLNSLPLS